MGTRRWIGIVAATVVVAIVGAGCTPPSSPSPIGAQCSAPPVLIPGASLYNCNLAGLDLSGLDLHGVDLRGADLTGADLSGANLTSARLEGASASSILTLEYSIRFASMEKSPSTSATCG